MKLVGFWIALAIGLFLILENKTTVNGTGVGLQSNRTKLIVGIVLIIISAFIITSILRKG